MGTNMGELILLMKVGSQKLVLWIAAFVLALPVIAKDPSYKVTIKPLSDKEVEEIFRDLPVLPTNASAKVTPQAKPKSKCKKALRILGKTQ